MKIMSFSRSEKPPLQGFAMYRFVRQSCCTVLLLLTACSPDTSRLPTLPAEASIIAFGDSLTSGVGASTGGDYPNQLAKITGFRIINAGVPAEISAAGLERLPALLDQGPADLLILIHGGNDLLRHIPTDQTVANLRQMLTEARGRGVPVLMLGVPKPAVWGLSSAEFYRELAAATGTPIDTAILPAILSDNALKSDLVHPNNEGYRHLAEAIAELLRRTGAWRGARASTQ